MISECIYLGRDKIDSVIRGYEPPSVVPEFYAAINIHDPGTNPTHYPHWVRPTLILSFHDFSPRITGDKVLDKKTRELIKLDGVELFDDNHAQKILHFAHQLNEDKKNWKLLVNCEAGISRSACVARFLKSAIRCEIRGLSFPHTDTFNRLMMQLLTKNYSLLLTNYLRKTHDSNANSEPTLRGEESNT